MRAQPTQVGGILGMAGTRFGWMHDAGFSDMWVEYLAGPDSMVGDQAHLIVAAKNGSAMGSRSGCRS